MKKIIISLALLLVLVISGCTTTTGRTNQVMTVNLYDSSKNLITRGNLATVSGIEGVQYITFTTKVRNTGDANLYVFINSATPSELQNAYYSSNPKTISTGQEVEWESDLIDINKWIGQSVTFTIRVLGRYEVGGQTKEIPKVAQITLNIQEDPSGDMEVTVESSTGDTGIGTCVEENQPCTSQLDCCEGFECRDGTCQGEIQCLTSGTGCTENSECCDGSCDSTSFEVLVDTACETSSGDRCRSSGNAAVCPSGGEQCVAVKYHGCNTGSGCSEYDRETLVPGECLTINCGGGYEIEVFTTQTIRQC